MGDSIGSGVLFSSRRFFEGTRRCGFCDGGASFGFSGDCSRGLRREKKCGGNEVDVLRQRFFQQIGLG